MAITLHFAEGPYAGQSFTFSERENFVVGRMSPARFPLERDARVSRVHCVIELNPPLCRVEDLNSKHGTFVNDHKIGQPVPLRDGDRVRVGDTVIRIEVVGPGDVTLDGPPMTPDGTVASDRRPPAHVVIPRPEPPSLAQYRMSRRLGEGGMGVVFLAERVQDDKPFAIKFIRPAVSNDPIATARFLREASALCELRHPHIVEFRELGMAEGTLYFVMEYVPGVNAAELLEAHPNGLPVARAVGLMLQVLDGLAFAHSKRFVHRDIKPSNVMVETGDGGDFAKLADFGLARKYQESAMSGLTRIGSMGGTAEYMAPEQVLDFRNVGPAADQFSAGATLYRLLTARSRYADGAGSDDFMRKLLVGDPADTIVGVPAELEAALRRSMERRPEDRFADVTAFAEAIRPFG